MHGHDSMASAHRSVGQCVRGHVSLRERGERERENSDPGGPRAVNQGFRMVRARSGTWADRYSCLPNLQSLFRFSLVRFEHRVRVRFVRRIDVPLGARDMYHARSGVTNAGKSRQACL